VSHSSKHIIIIIQNKTPFANTVTIGLVCQWSVENDWLGSRPKIRISQTHSFG